MNKLICAALVAVFFLSGCGSEAPPESGYVRDKKVVDAHWESGMEQCSWEDTWTKPFQCDDYGDWYWEKKHEWKEKEYQLYVEDCVNRKEGKCHQGWITRSREVYMRYKINSHYPDPN